MPAPPTPTSQPDYTDHNRLIRGQIDFLNEQADLLDRQAASLVLLMDDAGGTMTRRGSDFYYQAKMLREQARDLRSQARELEGLLK